MVMRPRKHDVQKGSKRSVQVSTTAKKIIYFTRHSTPIQLENQKLHPNCCGVLPLDVALSLRKPSPCLLRYFDIFRGHVPHHHQIHQNHVGSARWCPSLSTTRCLASNELVTSSGRQGFGMWEKVAGGRLSMDWMPKLAMELHGGRGV